MQTKIIGPTLLMFLLAACGSSKNASDSNFEKAINANLAKECITIHPIILLAKAQRYPMTLSLFQANMFMRQAEVDRSNAQMIAPFEALAKAGVLSVTDGTEKSTNGRTEVTNATKTYTLTEVGKKALVKEDSTAMCIGHYKVDEITRFTQPADAMGQTMSRVSFTRSPVDVPSWAKNPAVQSAFGLDEKLAKNAKSTTTMILASDGWIDAMDFAK